MAGAQIIPQVGEQTAVPVFKRNLLRCSSSVCKSALLHVSLTLPAPQIQERILEVAENIPQEQVRSHGRADRGLPVPQIMGKTWR